MKNEINDNTTLVTAFFDIGRGDYHYVNCEPRSFGEYLKYFSFWARIKNELIIYTQPGLEDKIMKVRKEFGLEDRTKIITIGNIYDIEPNIFQRMLKVEKNQEFLNFRFFNSEVSNTAKYNYIMLLKYYFMKDVSCKKYAKDNIFWIDFGFNHGGQAFSDQEEFDFLIRGDKTSKIQLYTLPHKDATKVCSIDSLQYQLDTICGSPVVAPKEKCSDLYEYCKEAMNSLLSLDCIDDDQQLLLMATRTHEAEFELHESDWFMPLRDFWGGQHLTVSDTWRKGQKHSIKSTTIKTFRTIKHQVFVEKRIKSFLTRTKNKANYYYKNK